jgi:transcriptional regulator with XRE-family HTH domain
MRRRAGWSPARTARALRERGAQATRQLVERWERGTQQITPRTQPIAWDVLCEAAGTRLVGLRESRGKSQSEAGALIGLTGSAVSHYERHPERAPQSGWDALIAALEALPEISREDPGPELTVEELERLIADAPIGPGALASALGLTYATVWQWRKRRRPIPENYWRRIRELLTGPAPEPPDGIREQVLPRLLVLLERAGEQGLSLNMQTRRALKTGHPSMTRAVAMAVADGLAHWDLVSRERDGDGAVVERTAVVIGPGKRDGNDIRRASQKPRLREEAAIAAIKREPGIGLKALRLSVGATHRETVRLVERLLRQRTAHWGTVASLDAQHRRCRRQGLFHGPGESHRAKPLPAKKLRELRLERHLTEQRLGEIIAGELDVAEATVMAWYRSGVPPARAPQVLAVIEELEVIADSDFHRQAWREVCDALDGHLEGISQRQLPALVKPALRQLIRTGELTSKMLDAHLIHERPSPDRAGPGGRCVVLFSGKAPKEWDPGERMDAAEFRRILNRAELRNAEAARALDVSQGMISGWLDGTYTIPHGKRAQIRRLAPASPAAA